MHKPSLSFLSATVSAMPRTVALLKRVLAGLVFAWLALFMLTGCNSPETPSDAASSKATEQASVIRIAYLPITHALPVLMEKDAPPSTTNAPETLNVELVRYGSWPELMDALNTGRVDGASVLSVLALKAREQGIGLKMAALGHRGGNVIVAKTHITEAAALKGGVIAVPHRQSSHHILVRLMLDRAGLPPEAVRIVELSPPEMPAALTRGDIDAFCVAEPFGAQAVALGAGKVLFHGDDLWPNSLCCTLVFNETFLKKQPKLAARYTAAYMHAGAEAAKNPEHLRAVAARDLKVNGDMLDTSLSWISFSDLVIRSTEYAALTQLMVRYGLSEKPPSFEDAVQSPIQ